MIRFTLSRALPAALLLAIATAPCVASAEDGAPALADQAPAQAAVLASEELEATNGTGSEIDNSINESVVSTQELNATNTDNTIGGDVIAGQVNFADHALQGFSGIGNFAINTGAQSNIQSAITINVMTVAP